MTAVSVRGPAPLSAPSADGETPLHVALRRFLSGATSGTLTAALLQPLDVIKTTQQGRFLASLAPPSPLRGAGLAATAGALVRAEGLTALWKGLRATVVRVFFGAGIYFVALTGFADALGAGRAAATAAAASAGERAAGAGSVVGVGVVVVGGGVGGWAGNDARQFLAGALARSVATCVMTPVAVVKTRREWADARASAAAPRGTLRAMAAIARTEGVASLYSGILPTLARDAPFSGLYFALFQRLRIALEPVGGAAGSDATAAARTFAAGLAAGALATVLTHPADVLKTRLQLRPAQGRFVDGRVLLAELRGLLRAEGPRGLLVGAGARVAKRALSSAVTWTLFEEAMRRSGGGAV